MKSSSTASSGASSLGGSRVRSVSGSRHSLALGGSSQAAFRRPSPGINSLSTGKHAVVQSSKGHISSSPLNIDRRSSTHQPRLSSVTPVSKHRNRNFFQVGSQPVGVLRDPRPHKDRAFQSKIGQELVRYLTDHHFEHDMKHALSNNAMKSPTQKDFNCMFQWLYLRIDPGYRFVKNIDQEVPLILKQLRYPYERMITKSQIAAVGGQNWGTFLGLLHWMMQLVQISEGYASNRYSDACLDIGIDIKTDHIMFEFLSRGYKDWLAIDEETGDDEAAKVLIPHVNAMADAIEQSNSRYIAELEALEAENLRLKHEIEDLQRNTPDPATLDNQFCIMENDKIKVEEYNSLAVRRSEKYENRIQAL